MVDARAGVGVDIVTDNKPPNGPTRVGCGNEERPESRTLVAMPDSGLGEGLFGVDC
jgi:hypothetical protein